MIMQQDIAALVIKLYIQIKLPNTITLPLVMLSHVF